MGGECENIVNFIHDVATSSIPSSYPEGDDDADEKDTDLEREREGEGYDDEYEYDMICVFKSMRCVNVHVISPFIFYHHADVDEEEGVVIQDHSQHILSSFGLPLVYQSSPILIIIFIFIGGGCWCEG